MAAKCQCGLDFEELKATIYIETLLEEKRLSSEGFQLNCPACTSQVSVELNAYGLFLWQDDQGHKKLYRWSSAKAVLEALDKNRHKDEDQREKKSQIKLGGLTLIVPNDRLEKAEFNEKEICYKAVALFREKNGKIKHPDLPVKRKYLEMINADRDISVHETGNGEYRFRFYLHIRDEAMDIVLPGVPVKATKPTSDANMAFDGVHLVLWPKIDYAAWRRYFLRFGWTDGNSEIINENRELRVWAHACDDLSKQPDDRQWMLMSTETPDKTARFACVESRPDWIAIEFEDSRGEVLGGGLWRIPKPQKGSFPSLGGDSTSLGVDFGTSNTCLAWQSPNGPVMMPIESCDDFIIEGSDLPHELAFPDAWLPQRGFGRKHVLIPSELMTRKRVSELRNHRRVAEWKPVIDYSIPDSGIEAKFREEEYIIPDFKWKQMILDESLKSQCEDLQKRYLELVLLCTLAQLAKEDKLDSTASVKFSYPLAFDEKMQEALVSVLKSVARTVTEQTGVSVNIESLDDRTLPVDEARAAALSSSVSDPDVKACLYVDIGGGSTDIALLELLGGNKGRYSYVCSVQYAGGALASALVGGNCLKPGCDITHFRRQMRETSSVSELLSSNMLFARDKVNAITRKSDYFYGYLRDFLARLVAAHVIANQRSKGLTPGDADGQTQRETYKFMMLPLGNGWGFGHFLGSNFASGIFCKHLTAEANRIIDEAITHKVVSAQSPRIEVKGKAVENPKDAVAIGLLPSVLEGVNVEKQEWAWRSIVGWTTHGESGSKADWYYPVTMGDFQAPDGANKMPSNSVLDCPAEAWPAFSSDLPKPHELDKDLDKTRRHLPKCSPVTINDTWFRYSPYHVLLEELFKPALKGLI
jgi:hypothetical protein